jgi:hypothetical protein
VLVAVLVWVEERLGRNLPGSPVVDDVEGVEHGFNAWVVRLGMWDGSGGSGKAGGGQAVRNWVSENRKENLWAYGRELPSCHILRGFSLS